MRGVTATRWGWIAAVFVVSAVSAQTTENIEDRNTRSIGEHRFVPIPAPVDFGSAFAPTYLDFRLGVGGQWVKTRKGRGWTLPALASINGGVSWTGDKVALGFEGGVEMGSSFGNLVVDLGAGYAMTLRLAAGSSFRLGNTRLGVHLGWAGSQGSDISLRAYLEDQWAGNGPPDQRVAAAFVPMGSDDLSASIASATVVAPWLSFQGAWRMDYITTSRDVWRAFERRRVTQEQNRLSFATVAGPAFSCGPFVLAVGIGISGSRLEREDASPISRFNLIGGIEPSWMLRSELRLGLGFMGQTELSTNGGPLTTSADGQIGSRVSSTREETTRLVALQALLRLEKVF